MILPWFWRKPRDASIGAFYGMIVAQARSLVFYAGYGVSDTVDGRFGMLTLHLALAMRRLAAGGDRELGRFSQRIFDRFCSDLDDNLREMGVGDLAVPKEMRRLVGAFYGRQTAYNAALAQDDDGLLVNALARNIFGTAAAVGQPRRLAAYVRAAVRVLDAQHDSTLLRGEITFPDSEGFADDGI